MSKVGDYVPVRVERVGLIDEQGVEGVVILASLVDGKRKLIMRAFSGEAATHMDRFSRGDRSSLPTIYNVVESLAEKNGLHLSKVQIYSSSSALRGDMTFDGRGNHTVLEGYRASDCVALAMLYDAPILVQPALLTLDGSSA